jgi:Double-GTPase 2
MTDPEKLCQNAECQVATTGKCHFGHDPVERCPNYARDDVAPNEAGGLAQPATDIVSPVEICSGDVMYLQDLAAFVRTTPVRTVALVGDQGAGKTTLLASIYAMYCKGPFGGMAFAGSRTLVGFAKRHHLALLNSGRIDPTTPRTSRDEPVAFFHLALSPAVGPPVHLAISDRSGEAYGDARVDTHLVQNLPELQQADRVCFLLDGAKLASKEQRPAYARQFKQMIHALRDNGALANVGAVEVLATKFDLTKQGDSEEQLKYLDTYQRSLAAEFKTCGLTVECYQVCALPKADQSIGYLGLDEAIKRWTAPPLRPDLGPEPIADTPRQIDRMLAKVTGDTA